MILAAGAALPVLAGGAPAQAQSYQVAQGRDIVIRHDRLGRRVIVDAWTGDIISVGPLPGEGRNIRREARREARRDAIRRLDEAQDGFYEDEPEGGFVEIRPEDDWRDAPGDVIAAPEQPRIRKKTPAPEKPASAKIARAQQDKAAVTGGVAVKAKPMPESQPFPGGKNAAGSKDVAKIQVILDRAGLSPGAIDGKTGQNLAHALEAYREKTGQALDPTDLAGIEEVLAETGGAAFANYQITAPDAAGPFVASIPADYGDKARLVRLSYTSTLEMLAERFHMSESYLKALNPQATFKRPGERIMVAAIGSPAKGAVRKIVADKGREQVLAFDGAGRLVAAYPATIGSSDTPSPSGTVAVERIALDPEYTYNPKLNFKQGANDKVLRIPPGPNGPVGSVWIALSKPTYGIHGTPEPAQIGKTNSHGCVRLTNWDAMELAKLVSPGVSVVFAD